MDAYSPCAVAVLLDDFADLNSVAVRSCVIDAGSGDYFFSAAAGEVDVFSIAHSVLGFAVGVFFVVTCYAPRV